MANKKKTKDKSDNATDRISIRCNKKEKAMVERSAKNRNITIKECVLSSVRIADGKEKKRITDENNQIASMCAVNSFICYLHNWENEYPMENQVDAVEELKKKAKEVATELCQLVN
jgi:uncharacterized protein (DUF1778 family)